MPRCRCDGRLRIGRFEQILSGGRATWIERASAGCGASGVKSLTLMGTCSGTDLYQGADVVCCALTRPRCEDEVCRKEYKVD